MRLCYQLVVQTLILAPAFLPLPLCLSAHTHTDKFYTQTNSPPSDESTAPCKVLISLGNGHFNFLEVSEVQREEGQRFCCDVSKSSGHFEERAFVVVVWHFAVTSGFSGASGAVCLMVPTRSFKCSLKKRSSH